MSEELNEARDALLAEAKARADKGDLKGAAELLDKAAEPLKHSGSYRYARGSIALRQGDLDRATTELAAACDLDPEVAEFHGNLGAAWLERAKQGDEKALPRAREVLTKAAELGPRLPHVWTNLGTAQLQTGDAQSALESFDKALSLDQKHLPTLFNKAAAQKSLGRKDEARKTLEAVLAIDPKFAPALEAKTKL